MPPVLKLREIRLTERPVRFRHPFRFGAITVTGAHELFIHAEIEVDGRGRALGATAELLVPKWFNKNPKLTPDETVAQLRRAVEIARDIYLGHEIKDSAFGLHAACHARAVEACAEEGIPPLAASYAPAEIDKAVLDALLRCLKTDFFSALSRNLPGIHARLTPDLDPYAIVDFLGRRLVPPKVAVRHTVGMLDDLGELAETARGQGLRYFKLKLGGDPKADRERLIAIAQVLSPLGVDYRATLDANEQYASHAALTALVDALRRDPHLSDLSARILHIEQPMPRELTWDAPLGAMAEQFAFIIDEADDHYAAFPKALALGYRGVSSKSCKGIYKSLLNGARAQKAKMAGRDIFVAAEDLTCQAGLAVQQDTALAAFHGIAHAERNGHHYGDGFAAAPDAEARAFLAAHPDLYEDKEGRAQLAVRNGVLPTASLGQPGFASGVDPKLAGQNAGLLKTEKHREYAT